MSLATNLFYRAAGITSLSIGILGVFLPLLPTTCFVLLSAYCFAKSSPNWHQKMRENRYFGSTIRSWEDHQVIPEKVRKIAIASICIFGMLSFLLLPNWILKSLLILLLLTSIIVIEKYRQGRG